MAKVYKVEIYLTNYGENIDSMGDLKLNLKDALEDRFDSILHVSKIQESEEFEWHDDLKINNVSATTEDYEKYIRGDDA